MINKDSLVISSIVSIIFFIVISKIFGLGFFAKPAKSDMKPFDGSFLVEKVIDCNTLLLSDKTLVKLVGVGCPIDQFTKYAKVYNVDAEQEIKDLVDSNREVLRYIRSLVQGKELIFDFDKHQKDSAGRWWVYAFVPSIELISVKEYDLFNRMMVEYIDLLENNEEGQVDDYVFVNAAMIYAGYAIPQNTPFKETKYGELFRGLHEKSKKEKHGLWQENTDTTK